MRAEKKSDVRVLVTKIFKDTDIEMCQLIRHQVFVEGQNVPAHQEQDGLDAISEHYLLSYYELPVGTARVRYLDNSAKIERVAILETHQNQGLGYQLMHFILEDLKQNSLIKKAKLGAQTYAIPFYEKLGFSVCSQEYLDAGIWHKEMQLEF